MTNRFAAFARYVAIMALIAFALTELALRVITKRSAEGMPMIGRFPLLPYRPVEETVRRRLAELETSRYVIFDRDLGWSIAKNGTADHVHSNAQGIRAPRGTEYQNESPPGRIRIVTVGDSFTHGDGVEDSDTWQVRLEAARPDLQVMNLGVPGYGTDQAVLRWERDGAKYEHDLAILGIWPENICRNLNVVRYYLVPSGGYLSKPRFVPTKSGLQLVNFPVVAPSTLARILANPEGVPLLRHEYWFSAEESRPSFVRNLRTIRTIQSLASLHERRARRDALYSGADPIGNDVTVAIVERFVRGAKERGVIPIVLLIPMVELFDRYGSTDSLPLVRRLRERNIDVIDVSGDLRDAAARNEPLFMPDGHHSPRGNDFLAQKLASKLTPWLERVKVRH